jgi:plastocyanin
VETRESSVPEGADLHTGYSSVYLGEPIMFMKRFGVLFGLVALLALPAVGAAQYDYPSGGGGMMGGGSGGDTGGGDSVAIVDFAFQPMATFVGAGDTVTWSNTGAVAHTVDADSGAFESSTINPGGSFSQTFDAAGVYTYHCDFHPSMRGMVIVSGT